MTVADFEKGQNYVRNDHHVVRLLQHQTVAKYGPAEVVFNRDLYAEVKEYICNERASAQSPEVFLTSKGTPMDSSTVINTLSMEL